MEAPRRTLPIARRKLTLSFRFINVTEICLVQPFLFATNEISSSTQALVHEVIPFIDVLTKHVDDFISNPNLTPAVRAAAQRGRILLDQYYSKTNETDIYRSTMSEYYHLGLHSPTLTARRL